MTAKPLALTTAAQAGAVAPGPPHAVVRLAPKHGPGDHASMEEVSVRPISLERLATILPDDRAARLATAVERARTSFGDRVVWHVNATAHGGGVAEMLQTLLAYGNAAGIENRWMVLDGDAEFFAITKRLHNNLHGEPGDGGPLGPAEHAHYETVLRANLAELVDLVSPGDIVLVHDPQTAGLTAGLREQGARVVWRCHIGRDRPNDLSRMWVGLPSALRGTGGGDGVLPAGVRTWVGRRRPVGRHSSLDRPVRCEEHASATRGRHRHRSPGWASWPTVVGRVRSTSSGGTAAPGPCGPIAAREVSYTEETRLRPTYRSWCRSVVGTG